MGRQELRFSVRGRPAPQGSKRSVGKGRFVEASKYLPAWRRAVEVAILEAFIETEDSSSFDGPVSVNVIFFIDRPQKPKFKFPATTPDLDKLLRGLFDGISTAKAWTDDCLVVEVHAREVYTGLEPDSYPSAGCSVFISAK